MSYVISLLWFPILLAFALGTLVGMTSYGRQPRSDAAWLFGAAIVGAFLFVIAAWEMVPGRIGLWLEGTVLMLLAYFVGCLAGALWKDLQPKTVVAGGPADAPVPVRAASTSGAPKAIASGHPADASYIFKSRDPLRPAPAPAPHAPTPPVQAPAPLAFAAPPPPAPSAVSTPPAVAPMPRPASPPPAAPVSAPADETDTGDKPAGIAGPRSGKGDDLKRIRGIGRQNEDRLHGLGIWHFDQIAAWTPRETRWVGHFLAFPGRIEREDWVHQAKILAEGGETDFSRRVDRGEVETSLGESDKPA